MAEICIVCNEEITEDEGDYRDEGAVMHFKVCRPEYFKNPEKYGRKARKDLTPREIEELEEKGIQIELEEKGIQIKLEEKEKTKKVVITSIDISVNNAFNLTAKFFFASLVFLFLLALAGLGFAALFGYLQG